ncbi:MAG: hypothetical protein DCC59_11680 [Chloroflexi bacterium]|nr:MAG: hypothetical protein DCC59_11680 [Chloroflexota bacterium]
MPLSINWKHSGYKFFVSGKPFFRSAFTAVAKPESVPSAGVESEWPKMRNFDYGQFQITT